MRHNLSISFSKKPRDGGVVSVRNLTIRERLLRFLLGEPRKLTIIVPGDSVDTVAVSEVAEGGVV